MHNFKTFTGEENHSITTSEALTFLKQFREHYGPEAAAGVFFDKQAMQAILDQPEAVGLRYYYGTDMFGQTQLVLVGAKANRNDLLEGALLKLSMMDPPLNESGQYARGQVQHEISLTEASQLTARFQESLQSGQPKGGFFGKQAMLRLLDYAECVGVRFFYGAHKDGRRNIVGICVDKFGVAKMEGPSIEFSTPCPPLCGAPNLLNNLAAAELKASTEFAE